MKPSLLGKVTFLGGLFNLVHILIVPNAAKPIASLAPSLWPRSGVSNAISNFFGPGNSFCVGNGSVASRSSTTVCAPRVSSGESIEHWEASLYRLTRISYRRKIFHSHNKLRYGHRYRVFIGVTTSELTKINIGVTLYLPTTSGATPISRGYNIIVKPTSRNAAEFPLTVPGIDLGQATVDVDITVGLFVKPTRILKFTADVYRFYSL